MLNEIRTHAVALATLAGAPVAGFVLARVALGVTRRVSRRTDTIIDDTFIRHLNHPVEALLPLLLLNLVLPQVRIPAGAHALLAHVLGIALIGVVSWVLVSVAAAFRDALLARYPLDAAENLRARAVHTQLNVLMKIVVVVILVIAGGSALMTFEKVRQVGVSILASAGIAGVIIGFAAQRSIATIFAGFQIALTQPILLDDVVIVEGEWGRIEEITLTYVVVRIWDLRCLVREKIIGWLQKNHPESLPRLRAEVLPAAALRDP